MHPTKSLSSTTVNNALSVHLTTLRPTRPRGLEPEISWGRGQSELGLHDSRDRHSARDGSKLRSGVETEEPTHDRHCGASETRTRRVSRPNSEGGWRCGRVRRVREGRAPPAGRAEFPATRHAGRAWDERAPWWVCVRLHRPRSSPNVACRTTKGLREPLVPRPNEPAPLAGSESLAARRGTLVLSLHPAAAWMRVKWVTWTK